MKIRKGGLVGQQVVDLPDGSSITLKPWASGAHAAGQAAFSKALEEGLTQADANVAFTGGAAGWGAIAWSGMVDDETGEALEISPEMVELLIAQVPAAFTAVDREYVLPGLRQEQEKNASAPSLAGGTPAPAGALKEAPAA